MSKAGGLGPVPTAGPPAHQKSDARARRQQSTVPVEPSTTMLTYRLAGTTEDSGSTTTNPTGVRQEGERSPRARPTPPNLRAPRCAKERRRRIADLRFYLADRCPRRYGRRPGPVSFGASRGSGSPQTGSLKHCRHLDGIRSARVKVHSSVLGLPRAVRCGGCRILGLGPVIWHEAEGAFLFQGVVQSQDGV
jgi:hypothetical protein